MRIIDTHSHIYVDRFDDDIDDVIHRAKAIGVEKILLPNIDVQSINRVHSLVKRYPDYCYQMMGLHPTSVKEDWQECLSIIRTQFETYKYIAVGEIGIDLYWDKSFQKQQEQAFEEQLRWSIEFDVPVAIHTREATQEAISCIKNVGYNQLRGVFHSFVGTSEELNAIMSLDNFLVGINGVVTYKTSTLRDVLPTIDLSKILIETDSPYLPPVPYRGKRNESSYTFHIVEELAKIYNVSPDEVGDITTHNAMQLFSL